MVWVLKMTDQSIWMKMEMRSLVIVLTVRAKSSKIAVVVAAQDSFLSLLAMLKCRIAN